MPTSPLIFFAPFQLDVSNEQLWKDGRLIPLRPKTMAVLQYFLEHPKRLITNEELLRTVWKDTHVSKALPKDYVQELRKALNDDPKSPRFIETVHGRGYRFIGDVVSHHSATTVGSLLPPQSFTPVSQSSAPVGRETEIRQLHELFDRAVQGHRQTIFVTGEPGIGKTTLVEEFLAQAAQQSVALIARGQCLDQYGAGEPYMPVLEALGRLCRDAKNARLLELLKTRAPTWLVQLSGIVSPEELELLQQRIQSVTRERMLREMSEALEALTVASPLILVLEDLHWSDSSTLALLTALAQRTPPAKLLMIGTYRPADAREKNQPLTTLTHELRVHKQCQELSLRFLQEPAVAAYLITRFPQHRFPPTLSHTIHARTEGNPLFMINMVDYLVDQKLITKQENQWIVSTNGHKLENTVPESLQQMIEQHLEDCEPSHRRVLEVASVAGVEFSAAAVASGLQEEEEEVEELCATLARSGPFIRFQEYQEWPDGSITGQYSFVHALYQDVLYNRITPMRRMRLHQRIGERKETGYREKSNEVAGELASHFERSRDYERTVRHLQAAGKNALQRRAYQESIDHYMKALLLLQSWPETKEKVQQELMLQVDLGVPLLATKGYAAPEVEQTYARARELCRQVGETPQLFPVLWGLWVMYIVRGDLQIAQDLARQILQLARATNDPAFLLEAQVALGLTSLCLGQFDIALEHFQTGVKLYDPSQHADHALVYGQDPGVVCLSWEAAALWFLGHPSQALEKSREALTLARRLNYPYSLAYALGCASVFHQLRRDEARTHTQAEETIQLSEEQGFALWSAAGHILKGWALVARSQSEEGIAEIHNGLTAWQTTGAGFFQSYGFALLPEAYREAGKLDEGLAAVDGAFAIVEYRGERLWEAELYRLKGQLLLEQSLKQRKESPTQKQKKSKSKAHKPPLFDA